MSSIEKQWYCMLFNNSLAPCTMRLACSCWKLDNVSGREASGRTEGMGRGIIVDPAI